MTEKILRDVLKEAEENDQTGLLIWSCWRVWDDVGFTIKPGEELYDFALSQVEKDEEAMISINFSGFSMPGFIAVSVKKLIESQNFFNRILEFCEGKYNGPITLLPLNELADPC